MTATCAAESLWPGVTCQSEPHDDQTKHTAEDARGSYVWTTAGAEADKRGECPGCLRLICACPCQCDTCQTRKAQR